MIPPGSASFLVLLLSASTFAAVVARRLLAKRVPRLVAKPPAVSFDVALLLMSSGSAMGAFGEIVGLHGVPMQWLLVANMLLCILALVALVRGAKR